MGTLTIRGTRVTETETLWECSGDLPKKGAMLQLREPTNPVKYRAGNASHYDGGALFTLQLYSATATPVIAPGVHWILDFSVEDTEV